MPGTGTDQGHRNEVGPILSVFQLDRNHSNIRACEPAQAEEKPEKRLPNPLDLGLEEYLNRKASYLRRHSGRPFEHPIHLRWEDPSHSVPSSSEGKSQLRIGQDSLGNSGSKLDGENHDSPPPEIGYGS